MTSQVKRLNLFDRIWPDVNLSASNKNNVWQVKVNSPGISGNLQYQEPNKLDPSGLVTGRLAHLKIPDAPSIPVDPKKPAPKNVAAKNASKNDA